MGIHTGAVKGISRAPYRTQVLVALLQRNASDTLSQSEEAKVARVQRFLSAQDCAREIDEARERADAPRIQA